MNCTGLTKLEIPETVTSFDKFPFSGCSGLKELTIPVDLFSGKYGYSNEPEIFGGCTNIEHIRYTPGKTGKMWDRTTYDTYGEQYSAAPEYIAKEHLRSVVFDEGVTHIGNYAFYTSQNSENQVLKSITLPSTLESIGTYAFYGRSGLTDMQIPSGVTAFSRLSQISFFVKPGGVTTVMVVLLFLFVTCGILIS